MDVAERAPKSGPMSCSSVRITGKRIEIPDVDALRRLHVLLGSKDELAGRGEG